MPLYAYECKCGWQAELILSIADCDKPIRCRLCQRKMRKLFFPTVTVTPAATRKWGTALLRKEKDWKDVKAPKLPQNMPLMKRKGDEKI